MDPSYPAGTDNGRRGIFLQGATTVPFLAIILLLIGIPGTAGADETLWDLLKGGGQVVVIRHASTEPGFGDPQLMQ
ncbi:MAG: hypothetical protein A2Z40_01630 [Deltaproteobacteria bacterium RBG_19FT_COMBO_60_16]|nr:MAG: hypothetical protein A2Z40_01630 [Deltaproteobacteria bacterium RBG_19FT_COMBO_60_16]